METYITSTLNTLIRTAKDGEKGLTNAAEAVQDQELKALLFNKAKDFQDAVKVLQTHVLILGDTPEDGGSFLGTLHRGWVNLKAKVTGYNDADILEECEQGEAAAVKIYRKALDINLPEDLATLVRHQYEGLVENHHMIAQLCKVYSEKD